MTINSPQGRIIPAFHPKHLQNVTLERAKTTRHCHGCGQGIPKGSLCAAVKKAPKVVESQGFRRQVEVRKNLCQSCAMTMLPAAAEKLMDMFQEIAWEPRPVMIPGGRKRYSRVREVLVAVGTPQAATFHRGPTYSSPWIQSRTEARRKAREQSVYNSIPSEKDLYREEK